MSTRNVLIAVAAMLVLGVAFYFLVWSPLDDQEVALVAETATLDSQAQQLRNQLAQLQEIQDSELEIRADLTRLRALIPSGDPAQPSFVRAAQLAADASGVSIQSLTFGLPAVVEGGPPADAEGLVLAQISLNGVIEGGYFQVVDMFRRLEVEVVRAVQVDTLGITEGSEEFPQLSVAVTGRIFVLLPVSQVQEAPAPAPPPPGDGAAEGPTPAPTPGTTPPPVDGAAPPEGDTQ
ncbi:MAG TPA: type II secretion system protein GspM [Euzebya sp.]|nr:type II secretion system protein GspM [Euzebya sp.]